jgi:outer membrane protein OmpA-like peptidoglycan-associated protein
MAIGAPRRQVLFGSFAALVGLGDLLLLDLHLVPGYLQERGARARLLTTAPRSGTTPRALGSRPSLRVALRPRAVPAAPLTVAPKPVENKQPLLRIHFPAAASTMSAEAQGTLVAFATACRPSCGRFILVGHTDHRGPPLLNQRLGLQRAAAVATVLRQLGVPVEALSVKSEGSERPLDRADDEAAWARNRRVEIWSTRATRGE